MNKIKELKSQISWMEEDLSNLKEELLKLEGKETSEICVISAIDLIRQERKRQVEEEGWTAEQDSQYTKGELANAAACYAMDESNLGHYWSYYIRILWPFDLTWFKRSPSNRKRDLVKQEP